MTTATHSLDSTSGTTTVAELLARNGSLSGRMIPGRRTRAEATDRFLPVPAPAGQFSSAPGSAAHFDGTLPEPAPIFDPKSRRQADDDTPTMQYHYDRTALSAMLADDAGTLSPEAGKPPRTGRKIAGIAFAGAILVGGFGMLTATQSQGDQGPTASGPVPDNKAPEAVVPLAAAPVGAQVVTLAATPTSTAEIPAPAAARQPTQGKVSGKLPTTKRATPAPKAAATPPKASAPKLPQGTYVWPTNMADWTKLYDRGPGGKHRRH